MLEGLEQSELFGNCFGFTPVRQVEIEAIRRQRLAVPIQTQISVLVNAAKCGDSGKEEGRS